MGEAEHEDYRILPDHAAYTTERSQRESVEAQNRSKSSVYPICVNTADSDTLQLLPQIGRKRAQDIILYRQQHGPFHSPEDLLSVEGIGESVLREIEDLISFEEEEGG
jgi:competence protein ComEA